MKYAPNLHHRRSIRLRGYDYRQPGAYFVTICTAEKTCIFDEPELRAVTEDVWRSVAGEAGQVVDEFVVMPNHVHGIIWITEGDGVGAQQPRVSGARPQQDQLSCRTADTSVAAPLRRRGVAPGVDPGSLAAIVRAFKSATAKRINNLRGTPNAAIWQRNYYEHVIRSEMDLSRIREYIQDNPPRWNEDPDNPANVSK